MASTPLPLKMKGGHLRQGKGMDCRIWSGYHEG
jgi:hypothetical protein